MSTCSANATPSPTVEPLHHPEQAALQPRTAPLANVTNNVEKQEDAVSLGQKALLAKRMAKHNNPKMISPTDNFMTPITAKLSQVKKKHFSKSKPVGLANAFTLVSQPEAKEDKTPATTPAVEAENMEVDF